MLLKSFSQKANNLDIHYHFMSTVKSVLFKSHHTYYGCDKRISNARIAAQHILNIIALRLLIIRIKSGFKFTHISMKLCKNETVLKSDNWIERIILKLFNRSTVIRFIKQLRPNTFYRKISFV